MLFVHLLPELVAPERLAGGAVVMIDVLRASTTITQALVSGAAEVLPCLEVDEARRAAARFLPGEAVLGGEREGLPIEGFDLGNSPRDYTPAAVADKRVVFTTTNGTKALNVCGLARRVVIGAFTNAAAVAETLANEPRIHLLCAGTRGEITREDVLLAGLLVARWRRAAPGRELANDEARLAWAAWEAAFPARTPAAEELVRELRDTQGGRNLTRIGLAADIDDVARLDRYPLVPHRAACGALRATLPTG